VRVIQFPQNDESTERRVNGIKACLEYLYGEALAAGLPMVAHLVGAAREATRDELEQRRLAAR
jgi:hypothetical protein